MTRKARFQKPNVSKLCIGSLERWGHPKRTDLSENRFLVIGAVGSKLGIIFLRRTQIPGGARCAFGMMTK
jgi:hypothetical protein